MRPALAAAFVLGHRRTRRRLARARGLDAAVHEFNATVITVAGQRVAPLGRHWQSHGEGLATVFREYFAGTPR